MLHLALSISAIAWIYMVITGLGTITQLLVVSWLIGMLLIFAIPLKYDGASETSNVKLTGRGPES